MKRSQAKSSRPAGPRAPPLRAAAGSPVILRVNRAGAAAIARGGTRIAPENLVAGARPLRAGEPVRIEDPQGGPVGAGWFDPGREGPIALWPDGIPPEPGRLREKFARALARRRPLAARADLTVRRDVHGAADGLPGLLLDRYGDWGIAVARGPAWAQVLPEVAESLRGLAGLRGLWAWFQDDTHRAGGPEAPPGRCLAGEPPAAKYEVSENGLAFGVRLDSGIHTGLFLDQRENRQWLRGVSGGRRVLNTFAYTGSISVYAAAGGAREVVSVDLSAPALERARSNFLRNHLPPDRHRFVKEDVHRFLARAAREGDRYDIVVLDPPAFSRGKSGPLSALEGFRALLLAAARAATRPGILVAATPSQEWRPADFERMVLQACGSAGRAACLYRGRTGIDLPSSNPARDSALPKWVAVEIR